MYEVRYTTDELGGVFCSGSRLDSSHNVLSHAMAAAELFPRFAYVRRVTDNAVLGPYGQWIDADGEELPA